MIVRLHTPWYNDSIRSQKCVRRQLERRWRTYGLECDRCAYCLQRQLVTSSMHRAKLEYHTSQIADPSGDQRRLFKIVAKLLHNDTTSAIQNVNNVDACIEGAPQTCLLTAFEPATEAEIGMLLKSSPVKSCVFYPIPTWLLRNCMHDIVPVLTKIVDLSLRTGVVSSHLKGVHVRPVLKKPSLDTAVLNNYRPVSNLLYVSLQRDCLLTCQSTILACMTSPHTSPITALRWLLSVYRTTSCSQRTIKMLSSWCFLIYRLHLTPSTMK